MKRALLVVLALAALLGFGSGQARATHVVCGDTITQDTTLDSDLINCSFQSAAITVAADDVTLDLGGHTVDGDRFGLGIRSASERVTIRNGVVREFGFGLSLGPDSTVGPGGGPYFLRDLDLRDNSNRDGVIVRDSNDNEFVRITGGDRIFLLRAPSLILHSEAGIALVASPSSIVSHNSGGLFVRDSADVIVEDNRFIGEWSPVMLLNSQRTRFTGNTVTGGVLVSGTHDSVIARNRLEAGGMDTHGIALYGALDNLVERNVVSGYRSVSVLGASAIYVLGNDNRLVRNRLEDSVYGIHLVSSHKNVAVRNLLVRNRVGLHAEDSSDDNLVSRNRISDGEDGLLIEPAQTGNVLERNSSDHNSDDGFDIRSPGTTLTANSADRNRDLGIEAVAGVIDGGGNRAFGNGNPLQCLNVECK